MTSMHGTEQLEGKHTARPAIGLVTLDVEADDQWKRPGEFAFENIEVLPRFQALCDESGIRATYLVTYQVASDPRSRETLQKLAATGNCEIGAHCHAWSTPPCHPELDTGQWGTYLYEYPADMQREKLESLTHMLREAFGRAPISHRAGRWAIDPAGLSVLEDLGYAVDSSVTPLCDRRTSRGAELPGPFYVNAPHEPYHPSAADITAPGSMGILEIPVTLDFAREMPRWLRRGVTGILSRHGSQAFTARLLRKAGLARLIRLRPTHCSGRTMIRLTSRRLAHGASVLNYMIHSSELIPGQSDRVPDAEACDRVWRASRELFEHWADRGAVVPLGLGESAARLRTARAESLDEESEVPAAECRGSRAVPDVWVSIRRTYQWPKHGPT